MAKCNTQKQAVVPHLERCNPARQKYRYCCSIAAKRQDIKSSVHGEVQYTKAGHGPTCGKVQPCSSKISLLLFNRSQKAGHKVISAWRSAIHKSRPWSHMWKGA